MPVERRHRAGLEVAFARPHQDHRRRRHQVAAVVGPRRPAHRPGRAPIVEEGRAEIFQRELAALRSEVFPHALVAIDRARCFGEPGVLDLGARGIGDPVVGVHVEATLGRQPEGLVGRTFEAEGFALAVAHRHVVGAELGRREDRVHRVREIGALQHLAADEGQRHAGAALVVAIAFQRVGGEPDARRVQPRARQAARFGEGEDVGPVVAADAQHHAGLGALRPPVPVLSVQQHAVGAGLGQREGGGTAVGKVLFDVALARRGDHLRAGVHQHDRGEGFARALGNATHLLDVGGIELLDGGHHPLGATFELLPVDAVLQQRLGVHLGATAQAIGRRLAMGAAALARAARKVDEGKGCEVGHGCPKSA